MSRVPIAIMSFNRPHYLAEVLDSILAQTALNERPVFLFQDNAVNDRSGIRYADDTQIAACLAVFKQKIPSGTAMVWEHNLGSCRSYRKAEDHVFTDLGYDAAYFFEDDMVLSPHYLTMMDRLHAFAAECDRIGYFAAYGRHTLSLNRQRARSAELERLRYQWAVGLTRRHWAELRTWLAPYHEFLEHRDYRKRPTGKITAYYRERGFPMAYSTQDHARKVGTYALGRVSLSTVACFGKYIGAEGGLHDTPALYEQRKYGATVMYPEPVELNFPGAEELAHLHGKEVEVQWARLNGAVEEARDDADV